MKDVVAIVQARMTSRRFPGKVLAPFKGRVVLEHVLSAVEAALDRDVIVATSVDSSDDPIAAFANARGTRVVRGDLANVLSRFQEAGRTVDAEWLLRVNADSPLLDPELLRRVIGARRGADVVTTTRPRTFPKGRNAEMVKRSLLLAVNAAAATPEEREHVLPYFYSRPEAFRIHNVESGHPEWAGESLAIDTPDDLVRLERLTPEQLSRFSLAPS
jgi:spore coat polysaccharide biosynthesis protein SpsF